MFNKYPNVMGIQLDMTFDDFKDVIMGLGYNSLIYKNESGNEWFYVESKNNYNKHTLNIIFRENHLKFFAIINWREFFGFKDDITFKNITEIILNYFLKDYMCKSTYWSGVSTFEYCTNDNWLLWIKPKQEEIIFKINEQINE